MGVFVDVYSMIIANIQNAPTSKSIHKLMLNFAKLASFFFCYFVLMLHVFVIWFGIFMHFECRSISMQIIMKFIFFISCFTNAWYFYNFLSQLLLLRTWPYIHLYGMKKKMVFFHDSFYLRWWSIGNTNDCLLFWCCRFHLHYCFCDINMRSDM